MTDHNGRFLQTLATHRLLASLGIGALAGVEGDRQRSRFRSDDGGASRSWWIVAEVPGRLTLVFAGFVPLT